VTGARRDDSWKDVAGRSRNILVGYDGSAASRRALDAAADLAGYGSTLAVVSVARRRENDTLAEALDAEAVHEGERILAEAREHLYSRQLTARYIEPVGDPADQLVETAAKLGSDLVVVGRRSRNALQRLVLGSVSAKVVRRAPCDVLVVR
jgi:nucleotide-binding universal stress UspA family protein